MGVIHRRAESSPGVGWEGVEPQAYDDPALAGVRKHELIGEAEGARDYRMRYFEVPRAAGPRASATLTTTG